MPKDMHQKAAEHHDQAAKAHRTAAQQHSSNDHVSAKQQSAQAVINLKQLTSIRRRRTTRANSRNNAIASQQVASAGLRVGALFFRLKLTRRGGAAYRRICDNPVGCEQFRTASAGDSQPVPTPGPTFALVDQMNLSDERAL